MGPNQGDDQKLSPRLLLIFFPPSVQAAVTEQEEFLLLERRGEGDPFLWPINRCTSTIQQKKQEAATEKRSRSIPAINWVHSHAGKRGEEKGEASVFPYWSSSSSFTPRSRRSQIALIGVAFPGQSARVLNHFLKDFFLFFIVTYAKKN